MEKATQRLACWRFASHRHLCRQPDAGAEAVAQRALAHGNGGALPVAEHPGLQRAHIEFINILSNNTWCRIKGYTESAGCCKMPLLKNKGLSGFYAQAGAGLPCTKR